MVEYIAALAARSSETILSLDTAIQSMLTHNNTGTFLGPYRLEGTRQNAINYTGKFFNETHKREMGSEMTWCSCFYVLKHPSTFVIFNFLVMSVCIFTVFHDKQDLNLIRQIEHGS